MDRFVAMAWSPNAPGRTWAAEWWSKILAKARPDWRHLVEESGLHVMAAPHTRANVALDVATLGPVFQRGHEKRGIAAFDAQTSRQIVTTRGQKLIKDCWGGYVALWRDHLGALSVLRDPCGALPCYFIEHEGVLLLFSNPADIAYLPHLKWQIDWTYLQSFLTFNYFTTEKTGIVGMRELLPGQLLERSPPSDVRLSFAWDGHDLAARPNLTTTFSEAAEETRGLLAASVTAYATTHKHLLLSLSGGLDSSILAKLLTDERAAEVTGLFYAGPDYEEREREYARLAARHAGIDLVEIELDAAQENFSVLLTAPVMARPKLQSFAALIDRTSDELAKRIGADAFVQGHGGDNLFLQSGAQGRTFGDHLRLRGLTHDTLDQAYAAASLSQRSIWSIAGQALANLVTPARPFAMLEGRHWKEHRLIGDRAFDALPDAYRLHPWLKAADGLPHAKAEHLAGILALYNYYHDFGRGLTRQVIYPFFCQPLVEFALRTPAYLMIGNGIDRALQRQAFAGDAPPSIVRRTAKGTADHYQLSVLARQKAFLRELILDGDLVRNDWINKERVEQMLSTEFEAAGAGAAPIMMLAAAEAWLQSWKGQIGASHLAAI